MNIVRFCLGNTEASEFYKPTFQDTFSSRAITQKWAYNIQKTVKVWNKKMNIIYPLSLVNWGQNVALKGSGKDTVKLP